MTKFEGFSTKQQAHIESILGEFDSNFVKENFKKITNDSTMSEQNDKYSEFGRYNKVKNELKLNPRVFIVEDYSDGKRTMSMLSFILLHEIAHAIDRKMKISNKKEWQKLSGWSEDPIIKKGKKSLVIPRKNGEIQSQWYYDESKMNFPRWYSAFSPKEDFCDSFAFTFAGLENKFKNQNKVEFMKYLISTLKVQNII